MSELQSKKKLLIGYGNTLRRDDGVGPWVANYIRTNLSNNVDIRIHHQLTVELCETLSHYDLVVFVDAQLNADSAKSIIEITENNEQPIFTHTSTPHGLLQLTRKLYNRNPKAYWFRISGYEFNHGEGLSSKTLTIAQESCHSILELLR